MKNNKFKEFFRALKFTLISISAGIIQIGLFTLFNELCNWNYWAAYLTSLVASILWNFTINRKVTFHSANNIPIAMLKVAAFYAVFAPLSTWGTDVLNKIGWNEYIVEGIFLLANFVLEYIYDRFFVFGKSIDSALEDKNEKTTEEGFASPEETKNN